jgi:hypothetical protein
MAGRLLPEATTKTRWDVAQSNLGPLIKSLDEALPQDTQQEQSSAKGEDS